jgi:5-(carboxyamino)imidazole ribonucleotide synthase
MNIGIIGGGQLAQMLAQAGQSMNLSFAFLAPEPDACAAPYGNHFAYDYDDKNAIQQLSDWADVITYEFESIPVSVIAAFETNKPVHPSSSALEIASDRANEKQMFNNLGIATAEYRLVNSFDDLESGISELGFPSILKTRREGYDGKGQTLLRTKEQLQEAWEKVAGVACILEKVVKFDREVSIVAARSASGEMMTYPLAENTHGDGILKLSIALQNDPLQEKAEAIVHKVMQEMQYVGVMAIELFDVNGELAANELSPRVHNSGHWSMDGVEASQFENHLLAISNQRLKPVSLKQPAAMVNLIGQLPAKESVEKIPGAVMYDYGKAVRPGRKVGHINITASNSSGSSLSQNDFVNSVKAALELVNESELANNFQLR